MGGQALKAAFASRFPQGESRSQDELFRVLVAMRRLKTWGLLSWASGCHHPGGAGKGPSTRTKRMPAPINPFANLPHSHPCGSIKHPLTYSPGWKMHVAGVVPLAVSIEARPQNMVGQRAKSRNTTLAMSLSANAPSAQEDELRCRGERFQSGLYLVTSIISAPPSTGMSVRCKSLEKGNQGPEAELHETPNDATAVAQSYNPSPQVSQKGNANCGEHKAPREFTETASLLRFLITTTEWGVHGVLHGEVTAHSRRNSEGRFPSQVSGGKIGARERSSLAQFLSSEKPQMLDASTIVRFGTRWRSCERPPQGLSVGGSLGSKSFEKSARIVRIVRYACWKISIGSEEEQVSAFINSSLPACSGRPTGSPSWVVAFEDNILVLEASSMIHSSAATDEGEWTEGNASFELCEALCIMSAQEAVNRRWLQLVNASRERCKPQDDAASCTGGESHGASYIAGSDT
ncbi:uncharacterized protein BDR25DRAFT_395219 [Lindgomyces ingoldianus]|uniref:Uncharacterized protein n=1 Tax=Lindgomyces ingoldianus TaxID=673940 RepID=A0ACB6QMS1_9PLEO|nr:uncharacterized protein BDR25DRAFT_395219 [Lindgomyces ingoldianus]KAF2467405.1 hypothetical protein BDR25DRAFT_395219 [Lindgomyces ingoldianus]